MYQCPKCESTNTEKDRSFAGGDTGDRKCNNCGYVGQSREFRKDK